VAFISGSTQSRLYWPEGSIPNTFTICSITRYTGGANGRILNGIGRNWLHGHHGGRSGMAYYEKVLMDDTKRSFSSDWAVMCGSNGLPSPTNILYNGAALGTDQGGLGGGTLGVNPTNSEQREYSDWALSFVAIWDQHLTAEEMQTASDALMEYLATGRSPVAVATDATPSSNTVTMVSGPSTVTATTMGPCNVTTTTIASNATTTTTTSTVSCPE
jgi:hypothetical protein